MEVEEEAGVEATCSIKELSNLLSAERMEVDLEVIQIRRAEYIQLTNTNRYVSARNWFEDMENFMLAKSPDKTVQSKRKDLGLIRAGNCYTKF